MDSIIREAMNLKAAGVKELLVISQDTAAYGVDKRYKLDFACGRPVHTKLIDLCRELGDSSLSRLHYVYPYPHVDDIVPLMAEGLILPYLVRFPACPSADSEADEASGLRRKES